MLVCWVPSTGGRESFGRYINKLFMKMCDYSLSSLNATEVEFFTGTGQLKKITCRLKLELLTLVSLSTLICGPSGLYTIVLIVCCHGYLGLYTIVLIVCGHGYRSMLGSLTLASLTQITFSTSISQFFAKEDEVIVCI